MTDATPPKTPKAATSKAATASKAATPPAPPVATAPPVAPPLPTPTQPPQPYTQQPYGAAGYPPQYGPRTNTLAIISPVGDS